MKNANVRHLEVGVKRKFARDGYNQPIPTSASGMIAFSLNLQFR